MAMVVADGGFSHAGASALAALILACLAQGARNFKKLHSHQPRRLWLW